MQIFLGFADVIADNRAHVDAAQRHFQFARKNSAAKVLPVPLGPLKSARMGSNFFAFFARLINACSWRLGNGLTSSVCLLELENASLPVWYFLVAE